MWILFVKDCISLMKPEQGASGVPIIMSCLTSLQQGRADSVQTLLCTDSLIVRIKIITTPRVEASCGIVFLPGVLGSSTQ